MRTSDFENGFIDEGILDRGREYFILGKVVGLQYLEAKTILANVEGSRTYRVRISVDGGDILNWSCSCPYNAGDICKHVTAVFFALKQKNGKGDHDDASGQLNTDEIISTLSRDELADIVRQKANEDGLLVARLRAKFDGNNGDIPATKKSFRRIIRASIARVKRRGGIDYGDTYEAVEGAGEVFDQCMQEEVLNPERAIAGYESIIEELAPTINYTDDSDGDIGDLIRGSFDRLKQCAVRILPKKVSANLFEYVIKESQKDLYQEWDWPWEFLRIAAEIADRSQEQSLLDTANKIVEMAVERRKKREIEFPSYPAKPSGKDPFFDRYDHGRVAEMGLRLTERLYNNADVDRFLANHRNLYNMREKEIERLITRGDHEIARTIAEEGIAQAIKEKYPGLVNTFRKYLLTIAEKTKDATSICSLAQVLYLDNHQHEAQYYDLLKRYTASNRWSAVRKSLIKELDTDWDRARLFEYEKSWDELSKLVEKSPSLVSYYEEYLIKKHKDILVKAYEKLVEEGMEYPGGRGQYQEKCQMLLKLKKYGAKNKARDIVADWRKKYERRKALMDELDKLWCHTSETYTTSIEQH